MSATVFFSSSNEIATLSNTFSVAGVPTDPTVATLTVTSPTNVVTTYTGGQLTHVALSGLYSRDITCNEAGIWSYRWDGTTTASDTVVGTWQVEETALGHLYATVEAVKSRLAITNTNFDFELHSACFSASRWLEQYCERTFWQTLDTEARTFCPDDSYCLSLPSFCDLVEIVTLKTGTGGVYGTTWTAADYQLWPLNPAAGPETKPYTKIKAVGGQTFPTTYSSAERADTVEITGVFGWPAVPYGIRQAALILAAETFKRKDTTLGGGGEGEFAVRIGENRLARTFADQYRRYSMLVA